MDVDFLIVSGEDVVDNIVLIVIFFLNIFECMDCGEGLFGEFVVECEGCKVMDMFVSMFELIEYVVVCIDFGEGFVGCFFIDGEFVDWVMGVVVWIESFFDEVENGEGLFVMLILDVEMKELFVGLFVDFEVIFIDVCVIVNDF